MNSGALTGSDLATPRRLAQRLEQDIRRRGLAPGDRYITASQAATCFNISQATANRAMALLVKREVLRRSRRNGTFIGPKPVPPSTVGGLIVCVIRPEDCAEAFDVIRSDEIIGALRQAQGSCDNAAVRFIGYLEKHAAVDPSVDTASMDDTMPLLGTRLLRREEDEQWVEAASNEGAAMVAEAAQRLRAGKIVFCSEYKK